MLQCSMFLFAATALSTASPSSLELEVRESFAPGVPVLVRVEALDDAGMVDLALWDARVTIELEGEDATLSSNTVQLFNGRGSALVEIGGEGTLTLTARLGELSDSRELERAELSSSRSVSGALEGDDLAWGGVVRVLADVRVPVGETLRVAAGTLVLIEGVESGEDGADLDIEGAIVVEGTHDRPVTFTAADPDRPWGEIDHLGAVGSTYRHAIITRAGNSQRGGHTSSGPALRPRSSRITLEGCTIADIAGKIMQSSGGDLRVRDCLFSRAVMGPEIAGTQLIMERCHVTEFYGADDNDGIYLHDQRSSQILRIEDSVFASGDGPHCPDACSDDGIDTLGAVVTIEGCIVRDWSDKGISVFHDEVSISGCVVVDNDKGVSAKTGNGDTVRVRIDRSTLAGNLYGVEARNKGGSDPDAEVIYEISNSILQSEGDESQDIRSDYDLSSISVRYSALSAPSDASIEEAIYSDPGFVDAAVHNYRLRSGSPCIDSGDPAASLDPDGTRADMGAFPFELGAPSATARFMRGDVNGDASTDVSDAVALLLRLFSTLEIDCDDAADSNDDGTIDVSDAIATLDRLFRGAAPLPPPSSACGIDPSDDGLDCVRDICVAAR